MILFLLSQLSELMLWHLYEHRATRVVLALNQGVANNLNAAGIKNYPYFQKARMEDSCFAKKFMPGILSEIKIDGFEAWRSLSIDRFRFWAVDESDKINLWAETCAELVIPIDLNEPAIWQAARAFTQKHKRVTAIKTTSIRTREFFEFMPYLPISTAIVSFPEEASLIESMNQEVQIISKSSEPGIYSWPKETEGQPSSRIAKILFSGSQQPNTFGVVFDKERDTEFCRLLNANFIPGENRFAANMIVFPRDKRSETLFKSVVPKKLRSARNMIFTNDLKMWRHCHGACLLKPDEEYVNNYIGRKIRVMVLDPLGRGKFSDFSKPGIEVSEQ